MFSCLAMLFGPIKPVASFINVKLKKQPTFVQERLRGRVLSKVYNTDKGFDLFRYESELKRKLRLTMTVLFFTVHMWVLSSNRKSDSEVGITFIYLHPRQPKLLGYEAPKTMAAPVRTNQVNQVIHHPRTTFETVVMNVVSQ